MLLVAAAFVFELAPATGSALATIARWPLAAGLLLAALAAVVRWAPAEHRTWRWVTFGTGLVVGAWLVMSLLFGIYLREIADYGSIFGNLATVIVGFEYAYLSAIVFLAGLSVDGIAQRGLIGRTRRPRLGRVAAGYWQPPSGPRRGSRPCCARW